MPPFAKIILASSKEPNEEPDEEPSLQTSDYSL